MTTIMQWASNWRVLTLASGALVVLLLAVQSLAVMMLWNGIMPSLIGAGTLDLLRAFGLLVLIRTLVGGVGSDR